MGGVLARVGLVALALGGVALGAPRGEPAEDEDPAERARVDALLARWERQAAGARTIVARFSRVDRSPDWKTETRYSGRVVLMSPNRARLELTRAGRRDGKGFDERVICTGREVYRYAAATRQVFIAAVDPTRRDLVDAGPVSLLFGLKAEEVKRRYRLSLLRDDRRRSVLRLIPRQSIDRGRFAWADVALARSTAEPEAIRLVAANGKDTETYTLHEVARNERVDPATFEATIPSGWSVVRIGADGRREGRRP